MKKWEVNIPISDKDILVIQDEDISKITSYLEDMYSVHLEYQSNLTDGITCILPNGLIVIGLTNNDPYIALHECTHAVFALKEIIGWSDNDEEVFCYTLEWVYKHVTKYINSHD